MTMNDFMWSVYDFRILSDGGQEEEVCSIANTVICDFVEANDLDIYAYDDVDKERLSIFNNDLWANMDDIFNLVDYKNQSALSFDFVGYCPDNSLASVSACYERITGEPFSCEDYNQYKQNGWVKFFGPIAIFFCEGD